MTSSCALWYTHTQVCAHTIRYKLKVFLKCSKAEKAVVIGRVSKPSPRKAVNSQTSSGTPQNRGPKGKVCTQESSERYSATQRISQEGGSPSTETTPCYSRVYSQAATVASGGEPGREVKMRCQKTNGHLWV